MDDGNIKDAYVFAYLQQHVGFLFVPTVTQQAHKVRKTLGHPS